MTQSCLALILAAGEGTRMRSGKPKVMHEVAGIPMLHHVLNVAAKSDCSELAVVAGNGFEQVSSSVLPSYSHTKIYEQRERLGTGHAVLAAREALEAHKGHVLVLFGDTPLLKPETLIRLREELDKEAAIVVLGFKTQDPTGYGRLLEQDGTLLAIREHKDASDEERLINFCNGGIMGLSGTHALDLLDRITNDNANQEYYLTDVVEIANSLELKVVAVEGDEEEVLGVNTRTGLAQVEALWQANRRNQLMESGVTMQAPQTVFLHADTHIEPDVIIEPNVVFGPGVVVQSGTRIRAFSHLEGATIGNNCEIGPYARLRPGAHLQEKSKVGNFVEIKNAEVGVCAKVNHLTYVGDAKVGANANIGAGTITCNYDGANKHLTIIGEGAFIGSNSSLVAPVSIGVGAYIASGSTITSDVPDEALGIARGKQANKDGYASEIRARNQKLKEDKAKN